jgi:hypothetical protein
MPRPKPPHIVRFTIRLNRAQGERVAALKVKLNARSDNEVFDYLVTVGTNQRDDLEQLVYSLFENLADTLSRRFQSLETVSQLHLALTDTFIKYAFTALPEVPSSLSPQPGRGPRKSMNRSTSSRYASSSAVGIRTLIPPPSWGLKTTRACPTLPEVEFDIDNATDTESAKSQKKRKVSDQPGFDPVAFAEPKPLPRASPGRRGICFVLSGSLAVGLRQVQGAGCLTGRWRLALILRSILRFRGPRTDAAQP